MIRRVVTGLMILAALSGWGCTKSANSFRAGDIVFQDLDTPQVAALKLATGSEWTHCGLVLQEGGTFVVYEALQPVQVVPLEQWIARGVNQRVVVKRLKNGDLVLSPEVLAKMKTIAGQFAGRDYDSYFQWTDDQLYCSELVWKVFDRAAGVDLATLRPLKSYDLSDALVKARLAERYGDSIPYDEPMVAPADLFASPLLETVYDSKAK
jgi:uncharacterized protein YycO